MKQIKIIKVELVVAAEAISADGTIALALGSFIDDNSDSLDYGGLAVFETNTTLLAEVEWTTGDAV